MTRHDKPSFAMPVEEPAEPVSARDSATVMVARDGDRGLEVFMLERHLRSDFAGGAYVFPGGKLDASDLDPGFAELMGGWSAESAKAMGEEDEERARAIAVCAIRETFEEAGILLARMSDGTPVRLATERGDRWIEYRRALQAKELSALEAARRAEIRFATDLLRFWGRLVTPVQAPRRYDTRFFIALMPEGQTPLHDDVETTASLWVRPADAVARSLDGSLSIIFPTRKALESIAEFDSATELFEAAVGRPVEPVLPRIVMENGEPRVVLPDGSMHAL
jgi:8-oxo-dGTP pyrophosphatase MutT (NUDIX family)